MSNTDPYNGLQAAINRCHAIGKPLMVGEIGIQFSRLSPASTTERATLFDAKFAAQFAAGSVGALLWCWSNTYSAVPPRDMEIAPGDPALALLGKY